MIKARGIKKSFGELLVLKGLDLDVAKGEIVAIVGASGAGKTTLLQILGTMSTPDAGEILVDGCNPFLLKEAQKARFRNSNIGFVFQFHHLLPEFTALENVMIPALIAGTSRKEAREKALALLEMVGLADRQGHKPSELSGGEQQRVAIARAIINSPSVLLADEPTGNLDSATKEQIHRLFLDLRTKLGQTIIIITHDQGLADLCDRALVMKDGCFV